MLRQVKTENGWVRGIEAADPRITAFKGVPFAAPPVGKNRWRAPQPCESWAGVRDCSRFAPISMQWIPGLGDDIYCREWHVDPEIPMGEDCLYLNIWTNAKKADEKKNEFEKQRFRAHIFSFPILPEYVIISPTIVAS